MRLRIQVTCPGGRRWRQWPMDFEGRAQRGATLVEFALIAPLFFGLILATIAGSLYVFEVQVANDAAQAGARWAVAAENFPQPVSPVNPPGCPTSEEVVPTSSGISLAARAAAGPFASSMVVEYVAASSGGSSGCQVFVTIPYVRLGGLLGFLPASVGAMAIDYVT